MGSGWSQDSDQWADTQQEVVHPEGDRLKVQRVSQGKGKSCSVMASVTWTSQWRKKETNILGLRSWPMFSLSPSLELDLLVLWSKRLVLVFVWLTAWRHTLSIWF